MSEAAMQGSGGRMEGAGSDRLMGVLDAALRYRSQIKLGSILAILIGLLLIAMTLPVGAGVSWLESVVRDLGVIGPLVFGAAYVIGALLFIPGLALTVAAGALFGLFWGLVTVSIASTTTGALAFLIARHLARDAVNEQARKYRKFEAVDRAIGQGGGRIVLMLRLVPVFPFSIGNYLLGLTRVRFWPYVLASWIGMLPGTFVYVYFGHVGRMGIQAAAEGGEGGGGPLQWTLLAIGGLAAIAVTVYITKLARRALQQQTEIVGEADEAGTEKGVAKEATVAEVLAARRRATGTLILAGTGVVMLILGACAQLQPNWLTRMFGPPTVVMAEAYAPKPDGPTFDHSTFDRLLARYVDEEGWVDYAALKARDRDALQAYIEELGEADFEALGRDEKLALLINAYNAFTLELILEHWDDGRLESIRDIPSSKRWDHERWRVGENVWSLNQIEHEQIRPKFKEPRIYWVVVCAAVGCPPLRPEAYVGDRIEEQLHDQGRLVHSGDRWFRYDRDSGIVHLTKLYEWYKDDYVQIDGGVLEHAAQYMPELREDLDADNAPSIRWLDYDWALNHREHAE